MTAIAFQIHNSPPFGYVHSRNSTTRRGNLHMNDLGGGGAQRAVANGAKEAAR